MKPLTSLSTFIAILIASAILLSGVKGGAQNTGPKPRPTPKSQTEQAERHNQTAQPTYTPPQPFISRAVIETPPLQTPTASPTPKGDNEANDYVGLGLAINGILASATLILAIVGIYQARAARDAANEAKRQANALDTTLTHTKQSADAAVANAEATAKQVVTLEKTLAATQIAANAARANVDTLIDAESAYLDIVVIEFGPMTVGIETIGPGEFVRKLRHGQPLVLGATVRNIGRTPAFEVGTVVEFSCIPALPNCIPRRSVGRTIDVIGAGDLKTVECKCDLPFAENEVDEIETGRVVLHIGWHFSFTGIAEATYDYEFPSYYKPRGTLRDPQFDFPGYPRMRRKRRN
jgi:hypothetical protein